MNPKGDVLPCHAAETISHLKFDNIREASKVDLGKPEAFNMYRGTDWMPDPCKSCDEEIDWGGCRCQAMALTEMLKNRPCLFYFPLHNEIFSMAAEEARRAPPEFIYRKYGVRFNSPI